MSTQMRLYYSPASPFARKCRILVREKGMLDSVEEVRIDPLTDRDLRRINPLSQVPVLVDDAGSVWTDSPVICARLDELRGAPRLIPEGEARWSVIRREVIADGIMEVGVKWRLESIRPEGERSPTWMARWRDGVLAAIAASDAQTVAESAPLDIASVASVCAVTWLDLRFPDLGWRDGAPKLAALQATLERRPSFMETRPS
jgi:glutathione S-transferase